MENEIIYNTDNWKYGIEDLKAIIVEQGFISKLAFIKMKWMIGEKISNDEKLKKHKKEVAEEIGYPVSELSRCMNWYKKSKQMYKCSEWEEIEEQIEKNLSWHKIVNQLPNPEEPEEQDEKIRLEEMKNIQRMRKIFRMLKKDIEENAITQTVHLLQYLIIKYNIDETKDYD